MHTGARATLDDPEIRSRLRREFLTSKYSDTLPGKATSDLSDSIPVKKVLFIEPAQLTPLPEPTELIDGPSHYTVKEHASQFNARLVDKYLSLKNSLISLKNGLYTLAVLIILIGAYISLVGTKANNIVVMQAAKLTAQANKAAITSPPTSTQNTSKSSVPSTIKPSAPAISSYVVAPTHPRYITIPKLGVDSRVLSVGVNADGALATPNNVYDAAWYKESSLPGQPGAMLIDGHVSSWATNGVFYGIKKLVAGDLIKIERGDGVIFTYSVVKSQIYPAGNVDMQSAITPVEAGKPGLNLITCTGKVSPGTSEFTERIVVYAKLQS